MVKLGLLNDVVVTTPAGRQSIGFGQIPTERRACRRVGVAFAFWAELTAMIGIAAKPGSALISRVAS